MNSEIGDVTQAQQCRKPEVTLLDLYSGCGAMSTGLCLGGNLSGVNLVTVCCYKYLSYFIGYLFLFHLFCLFFWNLWLVTFIYKCLFLFV